MEWRACQKALAALVSFHRLRWSTSWTLARLRGSAVRLVTRLVLVAYKRNVEVNEMERPPTKRQLAYIRLLAKKVGASLYLGNIKTLEEASKTIDTLKASAEWRTKACLRRRCRGQ
jgi:hypothetical protein